MEYSDQLKIVQGIGFDKYGFFGGTQDELVDVCFGSLNDCNIISPIQKVEAKTSLKLIPNPVYDQLNIESEIEIKKVSIFDVNGSLIFSGNSEIVDIEFLKSGIYHLSLLLVNNEVETTKFVKIY